jgi:AmpD protein
LFKWLLLLAGAYLFYCWLKGQKHLQPETAETSKPSSNKPPRVIEPEEMVQCQHCKLHLPKSEAKGFEDRFYCSPEHLNGLDQQGWVGFAKWRLSPNQDIRPEHVSPDLVVIHHISLPPGEFGLRNAGQYIIDFFQNQLDSKLHPYFEEIAGQKVSSHFLITRSGELVQFVSTQKKAWHAGVSSFMGREKCNDFSIGIELEGDGETPFEEEQYQALKKLIPILDARYPNLQFAGHSDIAPDRKTDPGIYFDWKKFQKETNVSQKNLPYGLTSR